MYGLFVPITIFAVIVLCGLAIACLRWLKKPDSVIVATVLILTALLAFLDLGTLELHKLSCNFWRRSTLIVESLMVPAWMYCSIICSRTAGQWLKVSRLLRVFTLLSLLLVLLALILPLDSIYYSPDFPEEPVLFLTSIGFAYYLAIVFCLVVTLVQFEATFTNATPQAFWNLKYFLTGLCLIVAVQLFYYSQALLYRTINMEYGVFRAFMFSVAGLLMLFALIRRDSNTKVTISQHVALRSVALLAVGTYLIILGVFGEGLKYFSGQFSRSVGVTLAFLAGLGLMLLFFSGRMRREVKVVLQKHFYQNKFDYRTQWIMFTDQLSSSNSDEMFQSVLEMYCSTFGVDGATLFLYDEQRDLYAVVAACRMDLKAETVQTGNSLVRYIREKGWVFFVRDQVAEVIDENSALFDTHNVSFVVPLVGVTRLDGFVMLGQLIKPDEQYSYEDFDLMKTYARQAYQTIRQHRLAQALVLSREEAAIGNMATFIMHDLKNQLSALSLMTENAPNFISNPEYQHDLIVSLQSTVAKMQHLIGNLKTLDKIKCLNPERTDLLELVEGCAGQLGGNHIVVSGASVFAAVDRNEMQKVVMNLLVNGIEASAPDQPVEVSVGNGDGHLYIRVEDQGLGMAPDFIHNKLFVPFSTTKPSGLGIGLFQSRQIVQAHGGNIDVISRPGAGSAFTVWLPNSEVLV